MIGAPSSLRLIRNAAALAIIYERRRLYHSQFFFRKINLALKISNPLNEKLGRGVKERDLDVSASWFVVGKRESVLTAVCGEPDDAIAW